MYSGIAVSKGIGIGVAKVLKSEQDPAGYSDTKIERQLKLTAPGAVLVMTELTPYLAGVLKNMSVSAVVCETGGATSHSALLVKAMGIPAVYGAEGVTEGIADGDTVIVDGINGFVYEKPAPDQIREFSSRKKDYQKDQERLVRFRSMKTEMACGTECKIFCNVSDHLGVLKMLDNGGEGVGLYRTEHLFLQSDHIPTEEEQLRTYSTIVKAMDDRPIVIRTLDIGGDKAVPGNYFSFEKEENPFLGYRGVRFSLGNRKIFSAQLRALLRASAYGNVSIMIPMVSCIEEMREVKSLIYEICGELRDEGHEYDEDIKIGTMIETPSAAAISDMLIHECDFFSVGSNDLVQYTMAADRGNRNVAYLHSVNQPSVLRLIRSVIKNANDAGKPVSVCGEAASDPMIIPVLAGFGLRYFSVDPLLVPETRRCLSEWRLDEAQKLAEDVVGLSTAADVREYIKVAMRKKSQQ